MGERIAATLHRLRQAHFVGASQEGHTADLAQVQREDFAGAVDRRRLGRRCLAESEAGIRPRV